MAFFKTIAKDTAVYGIVDIITKLISFFTFPIFANLLSVTDFGIQSLTSIICGLVSMFLMLGLNNAVQRYYFDKEVAESERSVIVSTALWVLIAWSLLVTIFALIIFYFSKNYFEQKHQILWVYVWLSLITNLISVIAIFCNDTLRLHFTPWKFAILTFLRNLLSIGLGILFLVKYKEGLTGLYWAGFISALLILPLALFFIKKDLVLTFNRKWAKELIRIGYPFIFMSLAYWLFSSMDRWLLGIMKDNIQVGLYSIAAKFSIIIIFLMTAIGQAFSPLAIKLMNEHPDTYRKNFGELLTFIFLLFTLIGLGISLFTHEFLILFTPKSYWPADNVTVISVVSLVIYATTLVTPIGISIEKKTYLLNRMAWITAIINLLLNIIFIYFFAAIGSAIATLLSYTVLTAMYLYYTQKYHTLELEKRELFIIYGLNIFICIVAFLFNFHSFSWGFVVIKILFMLAIIFILIKMKILELNKILSLYKN